MKIGDKVYCKKDMISKGKIVHEKNKIYLISSFNDHRLWIYSEPETTENGYLGYITNGQLVGNFEYFSEYFYTQKEYRNIKLKKLNEVKI